MYSIFSSNDSPRLERLPKTNPILDQEADPIFKGNTCLGVLVRNWIGKGGVEDRHSRCVALADVVKLLENNHLVDGQVRIVVKLVIGVLLETGCNPLVLLIDDHEILLVQSRRIQKA